MSEPRDRQLNSCPGIIRLSAPTATIPRPDLPYPWDVEFLYYCPVCRRQLTARPSRFLPRPRPRPELGTIRCGG